MRAQLAICILFLCTCTHGAFAQFSCADLTAPDWETKWHKVVADYYKNGGSSVDLIQDLAIKITNQQKICFDIEETKARIAREQAGQNSSSGVGFKAHGADGNWWVAAAANEKTALLIGFEKGANMVLKTLCTSGLTTFDQHAYDACIEKLRKENPTIDYSNNDKLFEGVDTFYRDADNKKLDIEYALLYIKGQQAGIPIKVLNDDLAGWRKEAH